MTPSAQAAQLAIFEFVDVPFVDSPSAYIFKNQDLAQSFTASRSYQLLRVEVMVHDLDPLFPVDPLNMTIQTDASGVPSGTVLASSMADGAFGYDWLAFDLVPAINVTVGQVLWIVLKDDNNMNQQSGYKWAMKSGDTYSGGTWATRTGGGSWGPNTGDDLLFRTWGLDGPQITAGLAVDSTTAGVSDPLVFTLFFNNSGTRVASFVWTNLTDRKSVV